MGDIYLFSCLATGYWRYYVNETIKKDGCYVKIKFKTTTNVGESKYVAAIIGIDSHFLISALFYLQTTLL